MLQFESYRKGLAVSTGLSVVAKALTFGVNMYVASCFGTTTTTDVFYFLYGLVFMVSLFVTSADASVVVPEMMRLSICESQEAERRFARLALTLYLLIGVGIALLVAVDPVRIFGLLSRFSADELSRQKTLLFLALPLFPLIILCTFLLDVLASKKMFSLPMIFSILTNTVVLLVVFILRGRVGIEGVFAGLLAGYALQFVILLLLSRGHFAWSLSFRFSALSREAYRNVAFAQGGNLSSLIMTYAPLYLLSGFGSGVITALSYGQKTADMITGLVTVQVSSVVAIKFNELYANNALDQLNVSFHKAVKLMVVILLPVVGTFFLFSREIITILFARGAFDGSSIERTSFFLKFLALALPATAFNTMVARLFMAGQKIRESVLYQTCMALLSVILLYLMVHLQGPTGYVSAVLLWNLANLLLMSTVMRRYFPFVGYMRLTGFLGKAAVVTIVPALLLYGAITAMTGNAFFAIPLFWVGLSALLFGGVIGLRLDDQMSQEFKRMLLKIRGSFRQQEEPANAQATPPIS